MAKLFQKFLKDITTFSEEEYTIKKEEGTVDERNYVKFWDLYNKSRHISIDDFNHFLNKFLRYYLKEELLLPIKVDVIFLL